MRNYFKASPFFKNTFFDLPFFKDNDFYKNTFFGTDATAPTDPIVSPPPKAPKAPKAPKILSATIYPNKPTNVWIEYDQLIQPNMLGHTGWSLQRGNNGITSAKLYFDGNFVIMAFNDDIRSFTDFTYDPTLTVDKIMNFEGKKAKAKKGAITFSRVDK